jgi:hypothetical protein
VLALFATGQIRAVFIPRIRFLTRIDDKKFFQKNNDDFLMASQKFFLLGL